MMLYQHFKGGLYIVTGEHYDATNPPVSTEKGAYPSKVLVSYFCCMTGVSYTREKQEFEETVSYQGRSGPRFRPIACSEDIAVDGGMV